MGWTGLAPLIRSLMKKTNYSIRIMKIQVLLRMSTPNGVPVIAKESVNGVPSDLTNGKLSN